jgi:uncharacterized membrane protein YbhN (UPF0104 family)
VDRLKHIPNYLKLLLRILITAAALTWVVRQIDFPTFKQALVQADWRMLVLVWLLRGSLFWVRSYKFQLILKKLDCKASVNTLFRASAVMTLYGLIMPGMLSLAAKWYILKRATGKGSHLVSAMLYNQVSIMVVLVAVGLLALVVTNPLTQLEVTRAQAGWFSAGAIGLFIIVLFAFGTMLSQHAGRHFDRVAEAILHTMPSFIHRKGHEILDQLRIFRTAGAPFHLCIALFTFLTSSVGEGLVYFMAAKAANISLPIMLFVWIQATVYILGRVPIFIGNCGAREIVIIGLLGIYHIDKHHALLMSAIIFSAYIFIAFLGALYQIVWSVNRKAPA